mgnify:CR=1 FL=1|uniref:Uncharacterized protein n=1 Tax=viral metagenome TaxID=1070528 RepID=A0A6C0EIS7_9ZZZZ
MENILLSNEGRIIISILWGLGLATLFRKVCVGRSCIVIKAPNIKTIQKNIYDFEGKCYKFNSTITKCN